ncbi:MAG: Fe-S protein assembly co-chaperone HscB [Burkholderiaceae bacterium]|nr:Fe-S protein assembly co-chaperone HscB [Burkholderiaceae bacterium]
MNLQDNDFALFGIPGRFAQDRAGLDARWKQLQREVHPDKFAAQGASAQRVAMQWSVRINEAYQRLKEPLSRAAYLCELRGAPIDAEKNTAMPTEFLMHQMEWREALDDAKSEAALLDLTAQVDRLRRELLQKCEVLLDANDDATAGAQANAKAAAQQVRALMFVQRFASELDDRLDQLGQ